MSDNSQSQPAVPGLEDLLCFAIHSTGFAFSRIYRQPLKRLGLTYPQYLVMVALWGENDVTVGHLCARLSLDTSTLTPLLKRLEASGFLTRRRSDTDERRVMVSLTEKGHALKPQAADMTRCIGESIGMPAAELARLNREIRSLRTNLEHAATAAGAM